MRGPSPSLTTRGSQESFALGGREAPFRADQDGERHGRKRPGLPKRRRARFRARRSKRRNRVLDLHILVAEHQEARRIALGQRPVERERRHDVGQREDAALLRGLDRIGAHPLQVEACHLAVLGEHRLQP
jgi:hypothetical protein